MKFYPGDRVMVHRPAQHLYWQTLSWGIVHETCSYALTVFFKYPRAVKMDIDISWMIVVPKCLTLLLGEAK